MKLIKSFCIVITVLSILMGCGGYEESKTDTNKKAQQNQAVGTDVSPSPGEDEIGQSNFTEGIKEKTFKTTPLRFEVYSKSQYVIVTINDTLNLNKLGISPGDLLGYFIFIFMFIP